MISFSKRTCKRLYIIFEEGLEFTDDLAQIISELKNLAELTIIFRDSKNFNTTVAQRLAKILSKLKNLSLFDISLSNFNSNDLLIILKGLESCKFLEDLNLSGNQLDSDCMSFIYNILANKWKNLTSLALANSKLDYDCSKVLSNILEVNKTISRLNISKIQLKTECLVEISKGLARNENLKVLNMFLIQLIQLAEMRLSMR